LVNRIGKSIADTFESMAIPLSHTNGTFLSYRNMALSRFYSAGSSHEMAMSAIAPMDILFADWRGLAIFIIERDIGELLLNTSMGDVELEDFRLPFPTIYLEMPESDFKVAYREDVGTLRGVYILEDPPGQRGTPVTFIFVSHSVSEEPFDDCIVSYPLFLRDGAILPQIQKRVNEFKSNDRAWAGEAINTKTFVEAFGWIMSILFYITTPDARIDWGKKRRGVPFKKTRPKSKRKHLPSDPVYPVGRGIVIGSTSGVSEGGRGEGSETGVRRRAHWVSGHFRRVPYGPERRRRRIRWIRPFVRGEGSEHVRPGLYRVKK
jgi:hypothetical protein